MRQNVGAFGAQNGMDFAAAKKTFLSWYDGYRQDVSRASAATIASLARPLSCFIDNLMG